MKPFGIFFIFLLAHTYGQNATQNEDKSCDAADGGVGECVPYYLCTETNTINTDGESIIDIRVLAACTVSLEVCCGSENKVPPQPTTTPPPLPPPTTSTVCGVKNNNGVNVQLVGQAPNKAQFGEFPWMVALMKETGGKREYSCGGALIHPQVVITAAHCVHNLPSTVKIYARAGEWDTQTTIEPFPHQERLVQKITIHKDFIRGNLFNDIAFLVLQTPMQLSQTVNVVCLPDEVVEDLDPSTCFVTGWGKNEFGASNLNQVIMKKVDLPTVRRNTCRNAIRNTLGPKFELHRSFVCAGGVVGKDACTGDGGSPLVCPIPDTTNQYMLSGLVAWGVGCAKEGVPGVYVNVAIFTAWIEDQFVYNNLDIAPYRLQYY